jgi:hypothetical protein
MSLIVLQHTAVDNYNVDPSYSIPTNGRITQGMLVGLDTNSFTQKACNTITPLGIAGDSLSDEYKTTAYSAQLIIGRGQKLASGAYAAYAAPKRWNSNRVSDNYNETIASGKMTVYIGAGRFATDQYVVTDAWTGSQGSKVYASGSGGISGTGAGLFTLASTNSRPVGYVLTPPAEYPSGVPGSDGAISDGLIWTDATASQATVDSSMSLGQFLQISLSI